MRVFGRVDNQNEHGAVIIIVAVCAAVFIAIAALVIDSLRALTTRQKMRIVCEASAMAAIDEFLKSPGDTTNWTDMQSILQAAENRANSIADKHLLKMMGPDADDLGQLGLKINGCTQLWCDGGVGGDLIPGTWYGPDSTGDPCGNGGNFPCFVPLQVNGDSLNAFRCQVKLTTPLRFLFAKIMGFSGVNLDASATAAQVPRRLLFLVDLSGSVTEMTHKLSNPVCDDACRQYFRRNPCGYSNPACKDYYFFYQCTSASGSYWGRHVAGIKTSFSYPKSDVDSFDCSTECYSGACPNLASGYGLRENFGVWLYPKCNYCGLEDDRSSPLDPRPWVSPAPWNSSLDGDAIKHYKSDFSLVRGIQDCSSGSCISRDFYIDTYQPGGPNTPIRGAQPLKSVLDGINFALREMNSRKVPGDLAGLIGFSNKVWGISAENIARVFPMAADLTTLIDITNTAKSKEDLDLPDLNHYIRRTLFPIDTDRGTNLPEALNRALQELGTQPGAETARNSVVLFSDGVTNCSDTTHCSNTYNSWLQSVSNLPPIIQNYVDSGIAIHVFLFGETNGLHTLDVSQGPGFTDCIDDPTARYFGIPFVDPLCGGSVCDAGDFSRAIVFGNGKFYRITGEMYDIALKTGGLFVPIRPPLVGPRPPCSATPVRQFFDPLGRSVDQQIKDAMDKIMGGVPVKLVD
ncbi:MAG: hypothetical protein D6719_10805 [Candidatus Dadabacteria bacterium]|nr:MAG: hypothetical protein D6719_10805 [Candidatus Dadabacteria bacterium]